MRDPVVTRIPKGTWPRASRNSEERLIVRFPALYRALASLFWRWLSPRSRLRRALIRRQLVSGWAAFARRDLELQWVRYAANAQYEIDPAFQRLLGMGAFVGSGAMREGFAEFMQDWASFEPEPELVLDFGDLLVVLGSVRARARASGLELDRELLQVITVRDGLATRDQLFLGWEEGMRAAGLDPDFIARLTAGCLRSSTTAGTTAG